MDDRSRERVDAHAMAAPVKGGRRRYRRPVLTEYGPLAKLTRGGGTATTDAGGAMGHSMCL